MSRKSRKHADRRRPAQEKPAAAVPRSTAAGSPQAAIGVCVALVLAAAVVFGRSVGFGFVDFDDPGTVSENPIVAQGLTFKGLGWAFTQTEVSSWIPLTILSHMLDSQLFGLWAGGHHLVNVLLHAATSMLLFLTFRVMTGAFWRCALVAALFALHPLRAESVAWISERKDLLSGLFFVLTLMAYARWTRQPGRSRMGVCVFLTLGLLSKAMLVTTPLVLLLLDHWPLQRTARIRWPRLVTEKFPFFFLCAAAAVAQLIAVQQGHSEAQAAPLAARAANAVVSCATYVVQMFWPAGLAGFYPFPKQGTEPLTLCAAAALLGAISVAAYRWRRQAPWFAVGWLWYLIMLAPVLGFIQAGDISRADRYTYLPHIGLYLSLAWALGSWCAGHARRAILAGTLAAVLLAAAAVMAYRQTGYWKDGETLWTRALDCTSNNATAHYNLGTGRLRNGKLDEAAAQYHLALDADPRFADAHMNLGRVLLEKGLPEEAIASYRKAIDINPRSAEAHFNLAIALSGKQRAQDALRHYQTALEIKPAYFDAHNNLGSLLLQGGKVDEAIHHYEQALRLQPGSVKAHNNLAVALVRKGRMAQAITHYNKVLEIEPDHDKALNSLAWLLATQPDAKLRDGARAVSLATRANERTGGNNPLVLRTLAAALAEAGRYEDALQTAQLGLERATAQENQSVARGLRDDMELYKARKPVR